MRRALVLIWVGLIEEFLSEEDAPEKVFCTNGYVQIVILETQTAKAATPEILATHCIPSAMSHDLKVEC